MLGRRIWAGSALLCLLVMSVLAAQAREFEIKLRSRSFTPEATTRMARTYLASLERERGHLMLQMMTPNDRWERARLEEAGVVFLQYVPDNTWFVSAPADLFTRPIAERAIRWAGPLVSEDRLHPRLQQDVPRRWAQAPDGRWRLYVRFFRDVAPRDAGELLTSLGIEVTHGYRALRAFEVLCAPEALDALVEDDRVMWVRETTPPPVEANDGNRANTHAEELQSAPYLLDGDGVVVAIWDSDLVDEEHPDFFGRLVLGEGGGTSDHGTHCAGSIGGDGSNSETHGGTELQWRGMAPGATILSYDWGNPIDEYDPAINTYGASVSSNSWIFGVDDSNCDTYGDYDFLAPEYDEVITGLYGPPITICFAAGNERDDGDCGMMGPPYLNYGVIPPPGTAKNMITVGAIHSNNDAMTQFSSWGPMDDGRIKPEVVAPGCQSNGDAGVTSTLPGGSYTSWCGTSMATPTASGCIALLQEAYLDSLGELPPPSLVKAIMINTARDLGNEGPDYAYGFGAIDVRKAVDEMKAGAFLVDEIEFGAQNSHYFEVLPGTDRLNVTLCWSDPAAAAGAYPTLINDLNLKLIDPDLNQYYPWVLDPSNPSSPATTGQNHRDVVEQVTVENPMPGRWTARVTASDLPEGPQAYSLSGTIPEPPCEGVVVRVPAEYLTIAAAIAAAQDCDTILVAPNTYTESLTIPKPLTLLSEGGPEATVIQASFFQRAIAISANATIDGFTIRGGVTLGSFPGGHGGGIFSVDASPTIRNCIVRGNIAEHAGGGIFTLGGVPTVEACVVDSNQANDDGAGIYMQGAQGGLIAGCIVHHNTCNGDGGGVSLLSNVVAIHHNTIADNVAAGVGGGMHLRTSISVALTANIVASNSAPSVGGIACDGTETLSCNDIWNNGEDTLDCPAGTDDFSADPMFCDPETGDYGIPLESPCAAANSPGDCGRVGALDAADCEMIDVAGGASGVPARFAVYAAVPNPLTRSTQIRFDLPERRSVSLRIYDVTGRLVRDLVDAPMNAGTYVRAWDGRDAGARVVASGIYFYRLSAGADLVTRKLVVLP